MNGPRVKTAVEIYIMVDSIFSVVLWEVCNFAGDAEFFGSLLQALLQERENLANQSAREIFVLRFLSRFDNPSTGSGRQGRISEPAMQSSQARCRRTVSVCPL